MAIEGYPNAFAHNGVELDSASSVYLTRNYLGNPKDVVAFNVDPDYWIPVSTTFHLVPSSAANWYIHGTIQYENADGGIKEIRAEVHDYYSGSTTPYSTKTEDASNELVVTLADGSIVHIGFIPLYTSIIADSETLGMIGIYTGITHSISTIINTRTTWQAVQTLPNVELYASDNAGLQEQQFVFPDSLELN